MGVLSLPDGGWREALRGTDLAFACVFNSSSAADARLRKYFHHLEKSLNAAARGGLRVGFFEFDADRGGREALDALLGKKHRPPAVVYFMKGCPVDCYLIRPDAKGNFKEEELGNSAERFLALTPEDLHFVVRLHAPFYYQCPGNGRLRFQIVALDSAPAGKVQLRLVVGIGDEDAVKEKACGPEAVGVGSFAASQDSFISIQEFLKAENVGNADCRLELVADGQLFEGLLPKLQLVTHAEWGFFVEGNRPIVAPAISLGAGTEGVAVGNTINVVCQEVNGATPQERRKGLTDPYPRTIVMRRRGPAPSPPAHRGNSLGRRSSARRDPGPAHSSTAFSLERLDAQGWPVGTAEIIRGSPAILRIGRCPHRDWDRCKKRKNCAAGDDREDCGNDAILFDPKDEARLEAERERIGGPFGLLIGRRAADILVYPDRVLIRARRKNIRRNAAPLVPGELQTLRDGDSLLFEAKEAKGAELLCRLEASGGRITALRLRCADSGLRGRRASRDERGTCVDLDHRRILEYVVRPE